MSRPWPKIQGIKKIKYCKSCGAQIEVKNLGRQLCERCGYRGRTNEKQDRADKGVK